MNKKILSMLGLCARARRLVSGEFAAENAVKSGSARLVLIAENASDNTKKLFRNKCTYYQVPYHVCFDKDALGAAIGCMERAVIAITDEGFAKTIASYFENSKQSGGCEDGR